MSMKVTPQANPPALPEIPQNGYTRIKAMAGFLGIHHQTLRRWWKKGQFPQPKELNGILLFDNAEVLAFTSQRMNKTT